MAQEQQAEFFRLDDSLYKIENEVPYIWHKRYGYWESFIEARMSDVYEQYSVITAEQYVQQVRDHCLPISRLEFLVATGCTGQTQSKLDDV